MKRATAPALLHTTRSEPERSYWYHGYLLTFLATGEDTGGAFSIVETVGRKDQSALPPRHVHTREEEVFYILEGAATFYTDDLEIKATAGSLVTLPRGVPHWFSIDSDEVRWLNLIMPAGFEQFFKTLGEPAHSAAFPLAPEEMDIPKIIAAAREHGCEILPT